MMRMNKKGDALMNFIIVLIVVVVIAGIVIIFNQSSIGKVSSALGSNDIVVKTAAQGCGILESNPQKAYCTDFKTIEKKSLFGTGIQYVNCEYLDKNISVSIPNPEKYDGIDCPEDTWKNKCDLVLKEKYDDKDYRVLINGKLCSQEELLAERLKDGGWCYNATSTSCVQYGSAELRISNCGVSNKKLYENQEECNSEKP